MNRQYQNTAAEAVHEFEQLAVGSGEPVQLLFPIEEVVTTVRQGLGELMRRVGVMFACAVMEEEVERRVGAKSQPIRHAMPIVGAPRKDTASLRDSGFPCHVHGFAVWMGPRSG